MALKRYLKLLSAGLVLALLIPFALAENPSDDVSGYNPFDPEGTLESLNGNSNAAGSAIVTPVPNATPLPSSSDPFASSVNDPFGTASAGSAPFGLGGASNPFGDAAATATVSPVVTIPGDNPFDPATAAPPVTQTNSVMFVVDSSLKITRKAAENSGTVVTVYFGDQLTVLATQGEWAQVQTGKGAKGYCPLTSLSVANPNTLSRPMYAQLNTTPIYRQPSTHGGRLRNLKKNDTVTMLAVTSDGLWARVTDGTNSGFTPTLYLDDAPSAEGTPVWCGVGSTPVMVNPDGWAQISTLSFGQQARLVGYINDNTIAKIRNEKGYVAYCDVAALTTTDPATLSTPVYIQASGRVMSTVAGEGGRYINVNKNAKMTLLGVDTTQQWALVKQGKAKRYIPYVFIGTDQLGKNYKTVVSTQDAPLYQTSKAGASILGTLPMGTQLTLLGGDGQFAKVATGSDGVTQSVTGFMAIQFLRNA